MKRKFGMKLVLICIAITGGIVIMGGLGFSIFASQNEINEEKHYTTAGINEIRIELSSTNVHIIRSEVGGEVKFLLYGKVKRETKLATQTNNDAILVTVERKYNAIPIQEETFLDVYIPGDYRKNLSVKTTSGQAKMDPVHLQDFLLDTSSGGFEAEEVVAGRITMNTSSGKFDIKRLDAKELNIRGTSSMVDIEECFTDKTGVEISSGSVTMKQFKGNLRLKGTSGNVHIACREFDDQNITIGTSSGDVAVELPANAEFVLDAATSSGKLQSDFLATGSVNTDKRKIQGQVGAKGNKVSIRTSSGSIGVYKIKGDS